MHSVLFPVNELKIGGAEQQLLELVRGIDKTRFHPIVAPLFPGGALEGEFRSIDGVEVVDLNRTGRYDPSPLWRIATLLATRRVDVVQPFLSPATFYGLLPALAIGTPAKVVTERCGTRLVRRLGYHVYRTAEDWLTRFADCVVANSEAGRDLLISRGIDPEKIRVVYNGISFERLRVDPHLVAENRRRLGGSVVVGILASLTPAKDHETFLRAAALASKRLPGLRCAIIGDGPLRGSLERLAESLEIGDRAVFFGNQRQVGSFLASCDLLVSSSCDNEGCSNSVLEAMALGVPVVATDVGGNKELVAQGETGYLTPVRDAASMAAAIEAAVCEQKTPAMAARAGNMIRDRFSLARMVGDYETIYETLLEFRQRDTVATSTIRG